MCRTLEAQDRPLQNAIPKHASKKSQIRAKHVAPSARPSGAGMAQGSWHMFGALLRMIILADEVSKICLESGHRVATRIDGDNFYAWHELGGGIQ